MTSDPESWWQGASAGLRAELAPPWMHGLVHGARSIKAASLSRTDPPATAFGTRQAAVLILLGWADETGPYLVLQQRSAGLRHHPGEICFPGGSREAGDTSPVETALREAHEEIGLTRGDADPVAVFPRLLIRATGFEVTAVIGHRREPSARPSDLRPDGTETAAVHCMPLTALNDDNWYELHHPVGWSGRAIDLPFGTLWGYTADLVAATISLLTSR